ncbi:hypothetical protein HHK36_008438 [Tetracentron sinense]|uniref:mitogen-activated protein kinase kinase kinase n=1 Tax=Tetracentron sinense TaxID=13715 RepID=A0A835DK11_TETSI|nr:hypothetical protein HHK36_008438 [Tetracentron sinense]
MNFFRNRRGLLAPGQLTRQRKLRHLSDHEVGLPLSNHFSSGSPRSTPVSPSPSSLDHRSPRSSFAVPQPLPLPELAVIPRHDPGFLYSSCGDHPLPSPKDVLIRRDGEEGDRMDSLIGDGTGDGVVSSSAIGRHSIFTFESPSTTRLIREDDGPVECKEDMLSIKKEEDRHIFFFETRSSGVVASGIAFAVQIWCIDRVQAFEKYVDCMYCSGFAYQTIRKSKEHVDRRSAKSPIDHSRKVLQDPNGVRSVQNNFRLIVPPMSAPTSCFSSPALSPRRSSVGEFFSSPYVAPQGCQAWSDPEAPAIDMLAGFFSHASPEKTVSSPERSPLHSPTVKSPRQNPKSQNGTASPMHHKLSPESSTAWHDSNGHVNVHPLPLPPATAITSQSAFVHQTTAKPDLSSMTSQWQKGKLIGRGTFGSVYVATNRETGALCAMKEVDLIPNDPKSVECIKQLEQEIKFLSQLKHPNIVQYYGSEILADHFHIYLEYVHPGSINKYIHDHYGAMTESVVRNFTRHILLGLAYLHSKKTVHRDIKGANLLVNASGVVKLADFGMAKHLSGQAAHLSLKGSPYWMAPEIMQAALQKDTNSDLALAVDIWSLGCTIIEMLNGKPPWSEFEGAAAMFKVLRESPPIPETLSPEGKDFLRCCFRRNPAERPSASKLLEHRFLRNSHHLDVLGQAFSGINLIVSLSCHQDKAYSPPEWTKNKTDTLPISPGSQITKGKLISNGETGHHSHPETSDNAAASSHHSPCSTLEALPSLSPPHSNHSTHNSSPSSNAPNSIHLGAGNNRRHALPQTHGKEIPHLF